MISKKQPVDEAGDSDELQALFDSIADSADSTASDNDVPAVPAGQKTNVSASAEAGDTDELQALFDSVAGEFDAHEKQVEAQESQLQKGTEASALTPAHEQVFNRIGQMTRQVHDTLRDLSGDDILQDTVAVIPDVRQRLNYIAQMTEQAACRVLNATDVAMPLQEALHEDAKKLQDKWALVFANQLPKEEFKLLAGETRDFVTRAADHSQKTSEQLIDIMMAQDFQDLTGQVIKKIVELAQTLETELLDLLLVVTPKNMRTTESDSLMNGPVIDKKRADVVTSQEQVDDLLGSLGF